MKTILYLLPSFVRSFCPFFLFEQAERLGENWAVIVFSRMIQPGIIKWNHINACMCFWTRRVRTRNFTVSIVIWIFKAHYIRLDCIGRQDGLKEGDRRGLQGPFWKLSVLTNFKCVPAALQARILFITAIVYHVKNLVGIGLRLHPDF